MRLIREATNVLRRVMGTSLLVVILVGVEVGVASAASTDYQKDKESLVRGLPQQQQAAMVRLANGGSETVPLLCDVLESATDAATMGRAGQALQANLKNVATIDDVTLDRLERLTKGSNPQSTALAAMAIMHIKGSARVRSILRGATDRQTNEQRKAQVLGAFVANIDGDKSELPYLRGFLKDKSEYVRVNAAGYLGSLGSAEGAGLCEEVLNRQPVSDEVRMLQMRAAIAAGRIGSRSLLPSLKKVSASKDYGLAQWQARNAIKEIELKGIPNRVDKLSYLRDALAEKENARWAVEQLVAMGDPAALEVLNVAAQQKDLAGAQEAREALMGLTASKQSKQ